VAGGHRKPALADRRMRPEGENCGRLEKEGRPGRSSESDAERTGRRERRNNSRMADESTSVREIRVTDAEAGRSGKVGWLLGTTGRPRGDRRCRLVPEGPPIPDHALRWGAVQGKWVPPACRKESGVCGILFGFIKRRLPPEGWARSGRDDCKSSLRRCLSFAEGGHNHVRAVAFRGDISCVPRELECRGECSRASFLFWFNRAHRVGRDWAGGATQETGAAPGHCGTGGRGLGPDGVGQAEGVGTTLAWGAG
jgi:hypothetical protein